MSLTLVLNGNTSVLTNDYFPPIGLDHTKQWYIGLLSIDTYNSIPNIIENKNDDFTFILPNKTKKSFKIPKGTFEVEHLKEFIESKLQHMHATKEIPASPFIMLRGNTNTQQCLMKCNYDIDFTKPNSVGRLLGFEKKVFPKNLQHTSTGTVHITNINSISVEVNIAQGAYKDGRQTHDIFQFYPNVPPGYKIHIVPANIIYHPLNTKYIDHISVRIIDDKGEEVDFSKEDITVRLHIKAWS